MQPSIVIKQGTSTAQVIQSGMMSVPMTVSSSMGGSIPNVITLNKAGGQNVVVTSQNLGGGQQGAILPNVQILNMRPGAQVGVQKSVATVSPRVVIGSPQVVGARPVTPGISVQNAQCLPTGQQGHLLLKTENGQYQLLRMRTVAAAASAPAARPGQDLRLVTAPAQMATAVSTSLAQIGVSGAPTPQIMHQSPAPAPSSAPTTYVKPADNTKEKCRNFLANLLDLSSKEPPSVEMNVRTLIQELIDAKVEPEQFCDRLERLLNASPQPCLIGFLKKSLPLLRQSLVTKELTIDGIVPPAPHVAFSIVNTPAPMTVLATSSHQLKPAPKPGSTIAVVQNIPVQSKINVNKVSSGKGIAVNKANLQRATPSTVIAPGKSLLKERKSTGQFMAQQYSDDKMAGDDDINDVAAMGGVNLAEESQRILGSTEMIGTQIRSCKEEYLVPLSLMQARIKSIVAKHGLEEPAPEVAGLLSHALHERLKTMIEKLAVIAQHRIDPVKTDGRYEVSQDVKGQLKFLEELDRVDKKRREDSEREILLRAAKSRSKNEDPEQAKLKAKAKEMQRAELEELRQREANVTALQAIGPRKKPRLDAPAGSSDTFVSSASTAAAGGLTGRSQMALRSRLKRINQRDMMFMLESDRDTAHSLLLYKSYLK